MSDETEVKESDVHAELRAARETVNHQADRLGLMTTKVLGLERLVGLQGVLLKHAGPHLDMEALFKAWNAYILNAGKIKDDKTQSRADVEAAQPQTKRQMMEHFVRELREQIGALNQLVKEREAEIEALKSPAAKK
jgi:hypothetical protein